MTIHARVIAAAACLLLAECASAADGQGDIGPPRAAKTEAARFRKAAEFFANLLDRLWAEREEARPGVAAQVLSQPELAEHLDGRLGKASFRYIHADLLWVSGDKSGSTKQFADLVGSRGAAILSARLLGRDEDRSWTTQEGVLAALLPPCWSTRSDASATVPPVLRASELVPIPIRTRQQGHFGQIACRLELVGGDRAGEFLEAVYCDLADPTRLGYDRNWGTMLSPTASPFWLKAAQYDLAAGREAAAFESLAKAYIYDTPKDRPRHMAVVDQYVACVQAGEPFLPPPATSEDPESDVAFAANLYVEMRMHPRALQLLSEPAWAYSKPLQDLRERIQSEWDDLLRDFLPQYTHLVLFGAPVTALPDLGRVIPFPESDEGLAKARAILQEARAGKPQ